MKPYDNGRGGRPAKFDEPSRPVTITLPDRILDRLIKINNNHTKNIIKTIKTILTNNTYNPTTNPIKKLHINKNKSLLIVARSPLLASVPWLTMIEIAPGRHLLSLRDGVPIEKLEVTLGDLLDSHPEASEAEKNVLRTLLTRIRTPRRNQAVRKEEILVVRSLPKKRTSH